MVSVLGPGRADNGAAGCSGPGKLGPGLSSARAGGRLRVRPRGGASAGPGTQGGEARRGRTRGRSGETWVRVPEDAGVRGEGWELRGPRGLWGAWGGGSTVRKGRGGPGAAPPEKGSQVHGEARGECAPGCPRSPLRCPANTERWWGESGPTAAQAGAEAAACVGVGYTRYPQKRPLGRTQPSSGMPEVQVGKRVLCLTADLSES